MVTECLIVLQGQTDVFHCCCRVQQEVLTMFYILLITISSWTGEPAVIRTLAALLTLELVGMLKFKVITITEIRNVPALPAVPVCS